VEGVDREWEEKSIGDLCSLITDGKHGDCENEADSRYYFVSVKDLINGDIFYNNVRHITKKDFEEKNKKLKAYFADINKNLTQSNALLIKLNSAVMILMV
jgi:type I restriction enzyme S subunit